MGNKTLKRCEIISVASDNACWYLKPNTTECSLLTTHYVQKEQQKTCRSHHWMKNISVCICTNMLQCLDHKKPLYHLRLRRTSLAIMSSCNRAVTSCKSFTSTAGSGTRDVRLDSQMTWEFSPNFCMSRQRIIVNVRGSNSTHGMKAAIATNRSKIRFDTLSWNYRLLHASLSLLLKKLPVSGCSLAPREKHSSPIFKSNLQLQRSSLRQLRQRGLRLPLRADGVHAGTEKLSPSFWPKHRPSRFVRMAQLYFLSIVLRRSHRMTS